MSTIISMDDQDAAFDKAVSVLSAGSVVVLPVGGVYAVVADAFRAAATQRIFAARRRSRATPLPVLVRSERQVGGLVGEVPEAVDRLMAAFWPGDLTLIMPAGEGMSWDLGNSLGTVQLRLPDDEFLKRLIGTVGPLACTSANRLEQPRPVTAEGAKQQLGVLVGAYLDGGELDGSVSTIVDCTGQSATVVREGSIPAHHIELVAAGELPWGERPEAPPEAADGDGAGGDAAEGADEGTATDDEAVEAADGGSPTDGDAPEGDDEGTDARGGRLTDGAEPATAPIAEPAPAPAADLAADDQSVEPSGDDELPTAPA